MENARSLRRNSPLRFSFVGFTTQLTEATRRATTARDPFFFFSISIIISILSASQTTMRKEKKKTPNISIRTPQYCCNTPRVRWGALFHGSRTTQQKISLQTQQVFNSQPRRGPARGCFKRPRHAAAPPRRRSGTITPSDVPSIAPLHTTTDSLSVDATFSPSDVNLTVTGYNRSATADAANIEKHLAPNYEM